MNARPAEETGLLARLRDRANPIVVQELRRGLRTRTFSVAFSLLLIACVVISLVAWGTSVDEHNVSGQGFFIAFFCCLALPAFFVLPYNAFRSLSADREERHWALLILTRLSPRQILGGKILSAFLQAVIFGSATAPFLLFAYLLQGIDLFTVAVVLGMSVVWQLFLTVAAATAATLATNSVWKGLLHMLVLAGLAWQTLNSLVFIGVTVESPRSFMADPAFLVGLAISLWIAVSYASIIFAVGVSRLTFDSDNTVYWPRLMLLVQALGCIALCFVFSSRKELALLYTVLGLLQAGVVGVFSASAHDGLSRRLRLASQRFTFFGLLLPGAVRGFRFFLLLLLVVTFAGLALASGRQTLHDGDAMIILGAGAFTALYVSAPILIGRGPLRALLPTPAHLRVFSFMFFGLGSGAPLMISAILGYSMSNKVINLLNPFVALSEWGHASYDHLDHFLFVCVLALGSAFVTDRLLASLDKEAIAREPLVAVPTAAVPSLAAPRETTGG